MLNLFKDIQFANPEFFWLLVLIPLYLVYYVLSYKKQYPEIRISNLEAAYSLKKSFKEYLIHLPLFFRLCTIALVIAILARPQTVLSKEKISSEGIDITLAIDISSSMLAEDFKPNRLEAAKQVAQDFIDGRPNDRIGLVVFAGESFTQCPITTDHKVVKAALNNLESGMVEDGTAIGMGLATAIDRLKDSKSKSKVVILMTDGVNNQGIIDPRTAADIAKSLGIRVYTVGVGTKGMAPYPFVDPFGRKRYQQTEVEIDEELLEYIANHTGVEYFRATDNNKLEDIFKKIDKLEKTRIEVSSFRRYTEKFLPLALLAGLFFMAEALTRYLIIKQIP